MKKLFNFNKVRNSVFVLFLFTSMISHASQMVCMDKQDRMRQNESQVLNWRDTMEHKFTARAFVSGVIVKLMSIKTNHYHFEVDFDGDLSTTDDRMEVVYNLKFGTVPPFNPGDQITACGDFVRDTHARFGGVVHWVHASPRINRHDSGFLKINESTTGLDTSSETDSSKESNE